MMSRKKLFELLNRQKEEQEAGSDRDSTVSAVPSTSAVSSNSLNGINSLPRGAGRARLIQPELLNRLNESSSNAIRQSRTNSASSNIQRPSTRSQNGSEVSSHSNSSNESNASEIKTKKIGTKGISVPLAVNYIPISCRPNTSIFEYEVSFEPNIHSNKIRHGLLTGVLNQVMSVFTFDGTSLYLPSKFPEKSTKFQAKNRNQDNSPVDITINFRRKKPMKECIHFYNVLFKQVMRKLEYVQFGQKMFDPTEPKVIPHRQLTIWPGYVLACDEYDGGLMLMLDTSHRVLFDSRVSDLLRRIRMSCANNPSQNFKDLVQKSIIGAIVLTPYNNKTYPINEVDFDQTPQNTFQTKTGEKSYIEYYKTQYGVDIHDINQPMLISYKDRKMMARNGSIQEDRTSIALIPELCQMTGLTDEMRKDNMVMRDIASHTRVTPNQRVDAIRKFIARVNETESARVILENWGLRLNDDVLKLEGRRLDHESIMFGKDRIISNISGDFSQNIGNNVLFEVIDLNNWILMYTNQDFRAKEEFLMNLDKCASGMGLKWQKPIEYRLPDDRNDSYTKALRQCLRPDTQMAVFICPTSRDDRYAIIKKICCSDQPIPSQVINARTLANKQKNRSIVQKILMQMNCKLGGSLWTIRIPFRNVMICGTDTYHSPNKNASSVGAFVASLNTTYTKWYSKATIQSNREELMHGLNISLEKALRSYKKLNGVHPDRIILYRDGVGDGQFELCKQFEISQLKQACRLADENYNPQITFVVVQKRVNTRIFAIDDRNRFDNAPPGTVVDHSITRRGLFDFYLVSQRMRHGTVTPSHYVVIENEANFPPDILQQLSYKLTYQYFNWPGSIRVPAPCQYAHKLAYLVGESVKREPAEMLNDKLFYL